MDEKQIDLAKSVYELCKEYPELPEILEGMGFEDITKPGMLATMGRFMTIPKGAITKKIDLYFIIEKLKENDYKVE